MADVEFDLEYDGPALRDHEMDVRDLAPALLATAELFQEMGRLAHPTDNTVSVNVRATTEGSFLVQLKLLYEETKDVLGGDAMTASLNLGALVAYVGQLINFLKRKRKADVVKEEAVEDPDAEPGLVRVTFADGSTLEVPKMVTALEKNHRIRHSLSEVVQPLNREGVDTLRVRKDDLTVGEITSVDAPAFVELDTSSADRDVLSSAEREVYLSIANAAFQKGNKWRLSDGQATFYATILDEDFLDRVERGERFSKLDVLHCLVRDIQWRDENGLHSETEVIQVLTHLPAPQGTLFENEKSEENESGP